MTGGGKCAYMYLCQCTVGATYCVMFSLLSVGRKDRHEEREHHFPLPVFTLNTGRGGGALALAESDREGVAENE